MSSLVSRDPLFALHLGSARITVVPKEESGEEPTLYLVDDQDQVVVLDHPREFAGLLHLARHGEPITGVRYFEQERVHPIALPVARIILNFTNLGPATCALLLTLTGERSSINWFDITEGVEGGQPLHVIGGEDDAQKRILAGQMLSMIRQVL